METAPTKKTGWYQLDGALLRDGQIPPLPKIILIDLLDRAAHPRGDAGTTQRAKAMKVTRQTLLAGEAWLEDNGYLLARRANGKQNIYLAQYPAVPVGAEGRGAFEAEFAALCDGQTCQGSRPVKNLDRSKDLTGSCQASGQVPPDGSLFRSPRDLETGSPPSPPLTQTDPVLTDHHAAGPEAPTTRTERENTRPLPEPPPAGRNCGVPRPHGASALHPDFLAEFQRYFGANAGRLDGRVAARFLAENGNPPLEVLAACVTDVRLFLEEKDGGDPGNLKLLLTALEKWERGGLDALRKPERPMIVNCLQRFDPSFEAAWRDREICRQRYGVTG